MSNAERQVITEILEVIALINNGQDAIGLLTTFLPMSVCMPGIELPDNTFTKQFYIGNGYSTNMSRVNSGNGAIVITDPSIVIGDQLTVQYQY